MDFHVTVEASTFLYALGFSCIAYAVSVVGMGIVDIYKSKATPVAPVTTKA